MNIKCPLPPRLFYIKCPPPNALLFKFGLQLVDCHPYVIDWLVRL